jgi:hypothetical protein
MAAAPECKTAWQKMPFAEGEAHQLMEPARIAAVAVREVRVRGVRVMGTRVIGVTHGS